MSATYLALLRGINVGGKNKLPMKDLTEIFVAAGCDNVRTFIQSGNVIFRASPALSRKLPTLIPTQIAARFGHQPPVILRTAAQLRDVVVNNPFLKQGSAEDILHVLFLADLPSRRAGRVSGSHAIPTRRLPRAGPGNLLAASPRRGRHQADQRLLRLEALHDLHRQKLANGDQAAGVDGRVI